MATSIPFSVWLEEDDEVIETVISIYAERARKAKRRKG